jgi:hypothetical protein
MKISSVRGLMRRVIATVFVLRHVLVAQPDLLQELVTRVAAHEKRALLESENYTFDYETSIAKYADGGRLSSKNVESGEVYFSRRGSVYVPLARNGKPLKSRAIDKGRRLALTKMEADANAKGQPAREFGDDRPWPGLRFGSVHMSLVDVLRYCRLEERGGAEPLLLVAFDDCKSPWPAESHFPHIRGLIRIYRSDSTVESWAAWVKGSSTEPLLFEARTQEGPGGLRWTHFQRLNLAVAPHLFPKDRVEVSFRWSNWRRFDTAIAAPPP